MLKMPLKPTNPGVCGRAVLRATS